MKKIKYLAIALTLSLIFLALTACGSTSVKDDFKEYVIIQIQLLYLKIMI